MTNLLGNVISAGIGAYGYLRGASISDKRNARIMRENRDFNYNAQKEFAQNSILWRVQDAKQAGLHPLYAIGGQTQGYTPSDYSYQSAYGEGVSRAYNHIANAMGQLDLKLKKSQIENTEASTEKQKLENLKVANEIKEQQGVAYVNSLNDKLDKKLGQSPNVDFLDPKADSPFSLFKSPTGSLHLNVNQSDLESPNDVYNWYLARMSPTSREYLLSLSKDYPNYTLHRDLIGGYYLSPDSKPLSFWQQAKLYASEIHPFLPELGTAGGLILGGVAIRNAGMVRKGFNLLKKQVGNIRAKFSRSKSFSYTPSLSPRETNGLKPKYRVDRDFFTP